MTATTREGCAALSNGFGNLTGCTANHSTRLHRIAQRRTRRCYDKPIDDMEDVRGGFWGHGAGWMDSLVAARECARARHGTAPPRNSRGPGHRGIGYPGAGRAAAGAAAAGHRVPRARA